MDRNSKRPRHPFRLDTLRRTSPLRHALLWIGLYIVIVNVGDALSSAVGIENAVSALLLVGLSAALVLYVGRDGLFARYGLSRPSPRDLRAAWYYVPLALVAVAPVLLATEAGLGATGTALAILLMICVGFLEELLFRGFLYRALLRSGGVGRAVVISGVTFGIGHVVNLLRGHTGAEQLVQIAVAIALGIVLALLVALTGSILPGAAFHVLLNVGGTLTHRGLTGDVAVMGITLAICAVYGPYLAWALRRRRGAGSAASRGDEAVKEESWAA